MTPTEPSFYKDLLDRMSDGVFFVDQHRRIQYWNQGAFRLTGYEAQDVVGHYCHDGVLCHLDHTGHRLCDDACPLLATLNDGSLHEANIFLRHKQGRRVPVAVRVQPVRDGAGAVVGAVQIFSDDSARHAELRRTEAMARLAFLDQLTQVPNRRFLEMSLRTALSECQVHKDPFAVLMIDLDRFKGINDQFGHASGDRALQLVAKTLTGSLRPTDLVGRWGGDEFLALVRHVNREILIALAQRCNLMVAKTSFSGPDGSPISLSISTGGTLAGPDDTPAALIKRADELMYQSKTGGGNLSTTG